MNKNTRWKTFLTVAAVALLALSGSVGAGEVTIVNPGFEEPVQADGDWSYDYPGWGGFNNVGGQSLGNWNPDATGDVFYGYGGISPEGENVGWVSGDTEDVGFAQVLTETLTVGTVYTLTVQVGDSSYYAFAGYKVQLLAGGSTDDNAGEITIGTLLAEDDSSVTIEDDTFGLSTVEYTYDPADAALLGQNLQIRLIAVPGSGEVDFDDVRLDAFLDLHPSPANNAIIEPSGNLELSWTNLDPNAPGGSVYVDVWFGTDPNKLNQLEYSKEITAGENTTSVIVDASVEGTYYWQVDSYLFGADQISDANMIEGTVYTFEALSDLPPSVVQIDTPDMITWSGQPVQLDTTVVDDGRSELTYSWSSDAGNGLDIEFDIVTAGIEHPEVKITKVPTSEVTIANAGFEAQKFNDGGYSSDCTDWLEGYYAVSTGQWYVGAAGGVWNPDEYTPPEGNNTAYTVSKAGEDRGLYQVLSRNVYPNTQLALSAIVLNPSSYNGGATADYRIELLAGGVVVASDTGPSPANNTTWTTAGCTYNSGPDADADPAIGQPLEIRLLAVDLDGGYEVDFDDIQLTTDPPLPPALGSAATVTLTFAVSDESNTTPLEDTITIDVYGDACEAARLGLGLAADNPGDIDGNCITDLKDLAAMAQTWLDDTGLTESVLLPVFGGGQ